MFTDLNLTADKLIGTYRTIEIIEKGGFAEIWFAHDVQLNRFVAIKILPRHENYSIIQFKRESELISRLEHPHVLPLYDFGEVANYRYLVMPYLTGGSLERRLERGRLTHDEIIRLMGPIASALDHIHAQNIVHRDLKPGNIIMDAQGLPYLADFGLAKRITEATAPVHSASGTLNYMSPEQFSGGEMSDRSDQYSLGILLFLLLTGQLPYEGSTALGMRQLSTDERLLNIALVDPSLPQGLNDLLWKLTDPDPLNRPASAMQVVQEMSAILGDSGSGVPVKTHPVCEFSSEDYRMLEARFLLAEQIPSWLSGVFSMRLTKFVLLDSLLRSLPSLATSDVRTLLLRGALEYNQHIEYWWKISNQEEQQRSCWHAVLHGDRAVSLRALRQALTTLPLHNVDEEILNTVGKNLTPLSDFTLVALEFLEKSLPASKQWVGETQHNNLLETDKNLCTLALSDSPLATRAAALIGKARRTFAVAGLPTKLGQAQPIFVVYETAGNLPAQINPWGRFGLTSRLALQQVTRQPLLALSQYAWAVLANILAFAIIVYFSFRSSDPANFFSGKRMLNTLGYAFIFGTIYATGIWVGRRTVQRLLVLPFWMRVVLGTLTGGLIVSYGFNLYSMLVLGNFGSDIISPAVSLSSGWLYVVGFVVSVNLPVDTQTLLGTIGISLAFILPWINYQVNPELTPPFIFDDTSPYSAFVLSCIAAVVAASITLGSEWLEAIKGQIIRKRLNTKIGI